MTTTIYRKVLIAFYFRYFIFIVNVEATSHIE